MNIFHCVFVAVLLWFSSASIAKPLTPQMQQIELTQQAFAALKANNFDAYSKAATALGEQPLQGYFDYYLLLNQLPNVSADKIAAYSKLHPDLPLSGSLKQKSLEEYGKNRRWSQFLTLQPTPPTQQNLVCYYWRAKLDQEGASAFSALPKLWLTGNSRPSSCDEYFVAAKQQGYLTDKLVWQRTLLAFGRHNKALINHLAAALSGQQAQQAEFALALLNDPLHILNLPQEWPADLQNLFKKQALLLIAKKDAPLALQLMTDASQGVGPIDKHVQQTVARQVAWFNVIRSEQEQRAWTDNWLEEYADGSLLQQRVRLAVREQKWLEVLYWIDRLAVSEQQDPHWLYWQARALQQLGSKKQAQAKFQQAAEHRTFWGFLAADEIKVPYALNPSELPVSSEPQQSAALQRIHWLMAVGETSLARSEWNHYLRRHPQERAAYVQYAQAQQWYGLLIDAAGLQGDHNALQWRFPIAYWSEFKQASQEQQDPLLLMAVARRESAFHPHVVSRAGAVGLMQLMPATAAQVARQQQQALPVKHSLITPETSIRLGASYLHSLLERYDNNRLLALAAYNAGPNNVDRWLGTQDNVPFDVWIESIPFYETREYVQAVLSYRVIFEANKQQKYSLKRNLLSKNEVKTNYHQALLKRIADLNAG